MKKATTAPTIERTTGHSAGLIIGALPETELDVVAGFRAARNPALIEVRKAHNQRVVEALVAQELARLGK